MNVTFPLAYSCPGGFLSGCSGPDIEDFSVRNNGTRFANDPVRAIERASIRWWMEQQAPYLTGRVLDFGCGKPGTCAVPQPYRDIVEKAGGEYVGVDTGDSYGTPLGTGRYTAAIINQVLEYLDCPADILWCIGELMDQGSRLIITYATCWPPTGESNDLQRFTQQGIAGLLKESGAKWGIEEHITRAVVRVAGREFPLGGACRARKL